MHFDRGHRVDAQHPVGVVVARGRRAVLQCDAFAEHRAEAEAGAAFDLRAHDVGIDHDAAVRGHHAAFDPDAAVGGFRHFRNGGDEAAERLVHGDAAIATGRDRLRPAGFLGGQRQHRAFAGVGRQQRQPQRDRILAGGRRDLVEQGLHHVRGMGVADRAPPQHRHRRRRMGHAHVDIGQRVRGIDDALGRGGIDAVLHHHPLERGAGHDRLADDVMLPAADVAVGVQAHAHAMHVQRAIAAAAHVGFARPLQFDRRAEVDRLGDFGGFDEHIAVEDRAPAETAAGLHHVQVDLIGFDAGDLRAGALHRVRHLQAAVDVQAVAVLVDHRIQRLQRRMREVREAIGRFDGLRGLGELAGGIAALQRDLAVLFRQRFVIAEHRVRRTRLRAAVVPGHLQRFAALDRGPGVVRHHRHAAADLHHVDHARHGFRGGGVEGFWLAAEARAVRDGRDQHARQLDVDGVVLAAVGLGARVDARGRVLADQRPRLRVLQRDLARHRQRRGGGDQAAVGRAAVAAGVDHFAVRGRQLADGDLPLLRGGLLQQFARGGAGLAVALPRRRHAAGAAGDLERAAQREIAVPLGIAGAAFDAHVVQRHVEFFGDQRRQAVIGILAHVELAGIHGDDAVGGDRDVGLERRARGGFAAGCRSGCGGVGGFHLAADHQRRADERGAEQELAARERRGLCRVDDVQRGKFATVEHVRSPYASAVAAALIAARMR